MVGCGKIPSNASRKQRRFLLFVFSPRFLLNRALHHVYSRTNSRQYYIRDAIFNFIRRDMIFASRPHIADAVAYICFAFLRRELACYLSAVAP